jgi:predicted HTH transcriptional regulator
MSIKTAEAFVNGVIHYVQKHGSITNRECRELLDVSYDNAIRLLGGLTRVGILRRQGVSSGTKYVLGARTPSSKAVTAFTDSVGRFIE